MLKSIKKIEIFCSNYLHISKLVCTFESTITLIHTAMENYIVEVEKGLNWNNGYLNWDNKVVEDISEASEFESEEEAQDAATLFNIEYGRGGKIYARVR